MAAIEGYAEHVMDAAAGDARRRGSASCERRLERRRERQARSPGCSPGCSGSS